MRVSKSATTLRELINIAITNEVITRDEYDNIIHIASEDEYDNIIHIASEDGHIDKQEEVLLREFHQMIHDKDIRFKKE
jgi:hypothetical protein